MAPLLPSFGHCSRHFGDSGPAGPDVQCHMADATRYHRLQLLLTLLGVGLSIAYPLALVLTGGGHGLAGWAARVSSARWVQVALVALALGAGHAALTLPLKMIRGFWLPRRFGLLHQPMPSWLGDQLKAAVIVGVLTLAAIEIVYALLVLTPRWWLVAAAVFIAAEIAMTAVLPIWIVPLFYRLTPLADRGLRDRLLALARRAGVAAVGVFVADQSRKSRTANAAVVGLGRTRRIILFDTLLSEFSPDEIEAVLAHELGHHAHGDMRRGLLVNGTLTLVTTGLAALCLELGVTLLGLAGPGDPAGLPWLALVTLALGLGQLPLTNGFSRWIERQADDFALATTDNAAAFVGAMERLAALNLAERRPSRLKEIFLYSHPALDRRIARAEGARRGASSGWDAGRGATADRGGVA